MSGLCGYFVATDSYGDVALWRRHGELPVRVLTQRDLRDDPKLWDAIVALIGPTP